MKLLVTDNLVSDLNQFDSFDISFEKVSIKDIPNQAQSFFDNEKYKFIFDEFITICLLYTSPSPRDTMSSRMPSSA